MRIALYGLCLSTLAACGANETHFVPDYADRYCDYYLDCSPADELTFDGVLTHDDCLALIGTDVDTMGAGCKYKGAKAKKCLDAMELLTCPAEGVALDEGLPLECDEVYIKCEVPPLDEDTEETNTDDTGL